MALGRGHWPRRALVLGAAVAGLLLTGCGSHLAVLHPVGPVGKAELHAVTVATVAMGSVFAVVLGVFIYALIRFRDRPGNPAPYLPEWDGSRRLEILWFAIPLAIIAVVAVPTVRTTFQLDHLPPTRDPLVVEVTSLDWKWLFEYPAQHVATVNYLKIPSDRPVLFELTADGPMNTFWIPQLGGMEYTMPGRVLPLWLESTKPGVYWGRSGNFSGVGFVHMAFRVDVVGPGAFQGWVAQLRRSGPPLSMAVYRRLLRPGTVAPAAYSSYPPATFPTRPTGFTLEGGVYMTPGGGSPALRATAGGMGM